MAVSKTAFGLVVNWLIGLRTDTQYVMALAANEAGGAGARGAQM